MDQVAILHLAAIHVLRVHLHRWLGHMSEQAAQRTGSGHAVPLVAQAPGGERKRKARLARLGHRLVGIGDKARAAIGRGEHAVFVQALAPGGITLAQRPLLRTLHLQHGPAQAGDVQVAAAGGLAVLVPDGFGAGGAVLQVIREQIGRGPAQAALQPAGKFGGNRPVVAGLARRRHGGAHPADAPLAVGHGTDLLAPGGSRQQQIGVAAGGGGGEGLLHHHEFGAFQRPAHRGLVRHGLGRVGAGNPERPDLAVGGGLKHLDGRLAGLPGHARHAPQRGHFSPVLWIGQIAVRTQQIGHSADFTATHRIGLAGQRERAGARFADLGRGQVQVDQRCILGRAAAGLVQALAVQAQRGRRGGEQARRLQQVLLRDPAGLRHALGRAVAHACLERLEAAGVGGDPGGIGPALPQHQVQHAVEKHDIGAGLDRQVQVGDLRGVGAPGIAEDDFQRRVGRLRVLDAPKQDRVRKGGVAAHDEKTLGTVDVLVAGRWRVSAQRLFVAGHGAAHAQA